MLSSLGVGALRQGQYAAMLATSGAFRTVRDEPVLHPRKKTWAIYLADDLWVCGASLSSGGIVYKMGARYVLCSRGGGARSTGHGRL